MSRLLAKLQARDRAQLVMIAYEAGVVTPGSRAVQLLPFVDGSLAGFAAELDEAVERLEVGDAVGVDRGRM